MGPGAFIAPEDIGRVTQGRRSARYDQCDDTCTTDCGHCKGAGRPTQSHPPTPLSRLRVELPATSTAYTSSQHRVFHAKRITYTASADGLFVFVSDNQGHTMTVLPEDQHRWPHPGLWFDELAADIVQSKAVA